MSTRKLLALLLCAVLAVVLLSVTAPASGAEQKVVFAPGEWGQTPGRGNQWCKEFLPAMGHFRICAEYGHGKTPMFTHQRRCANGRYGFIAWRNDNSSANGLCEFKGLKGGVRELERMAGALPTKLIEELKKPSPRERTKKS